MASDRNSDTIREQAVGWAVRSGDPMFADWEGFTEWLESDPRHADAYDAVCADVDEGAQLLAAHAPADHEEDRFEAIAPEPALSRRGWLGGAIAASVALAAGAALWPDGGRELYRIETAPGQMRVIAFEDGSRVDLAGGSAIELDRDDRRYARLAAGQALFTVRHDAADPFQVDVGADRLVDIGTVFDVRYDNAGFRVAVSEGAVAYNPDGANIRVAPGRVLIVPSSGQLSLAPIAAAQVGEWREGRLTFSDSPLDQVAADLSRATGTRYVVARPGSTQTVSGSILLDPLRQDPAAIGALLGVPVRAQGNHWVLGEN